MKHIAHVCLMKVFVILVVLGTVSCFDFGLALLETEGETEGVDFTYKDIDTIADGATQITPREPDWTNGTAPTGLTYSISPTTLPDGLILDPNSGEISGIPTKDTSDGTTPDAKVKTYTVTATGSDGYKAVGEIRISLKYPAPQNFSYADYVFPDGEPIDNSFSPVPNVTDIETDIGKGVRFSFDDTSFPPGLDIDKATGKITGTPENDDPIDNKYIVYTVKVTNSGGTATAAVKIKYIYQLPQDFNYGSTTYVFTDEQEISESEKPKPDKRLEQIGKGITFSASLPSGLNIAKDTGVIYGTPQNETSLDGKDLQYTVTATNSGGSKTATVTIKYVYQPPKNFSYKVTNSGIGPCTKTEPCRKPTAAVVFSPEPGKDSIGKSLTFTHSGLPSVWTLDNDGNVTANFTGSGDITITAKNSGGAATGTIDASVVSFDDINDFDSLRFAAENANSGDEIKITKPITGSGTIPELILPDNVQLELDGGNISNEVQKKITSNISTVGGLEAFGEMVEDGLNYINGSLQGNIGDASNPFSEPIGWGSTPTKVIQYNGTFDGNDKTVYLSLGSSTSSNGNDFGLFSKIGNDGSVKDLTVECNIYGAARVGAVAGSSAGAIENCTASGTINGGDDTGGICGNNGGTINGCKNYVTISSSGGISDNKLYAYIGGIAGLNSGEIRNCSNSGSISASGSYNASYSTTIYSAGGIAGGNYGGNIFNCYNTANIEAKCVGAGDKSTVHAGGIVGQNNYDKNIAPQIKNCYNNATISTEGYHITVGTLTTYSYASGGIAAVQQNGRTEIQNCYSEDYNNNLNSSHSGDILFHAPICSSAAISTPPQGTFTSTDYHVYYYRDSRVASDSVVNSADFYGQNVYFKNNQHYILTNSLLTALNGWVSDNKYYSWTTGTNGWPEFDIP